jgi:hypothetical protein
MGIRHRHFFTSWFVVAIIAIGAGASATPSPGVSAVYVDSDVDPTQGNVVVMGLTVAPPSPRVVGDLYAQTVGPAELYDQNGKLLDSIAPFTYTGETMATGNYTLVGHGLSSPPWSNVPLSFTTAKGEAPDLLGASVRGYLETNIRGSSPTR